jgi:hypothetical protein
MASCTKCGATLIASARFCAACGSPVVRASAPPPLPRRSSAPDSHTDPFAKTMLGESTVPDAEPPARPAVSPLASSAMAKPEALPRPTPSPIQAPAQPAPQPRVSQPSAPAAYVPPQQQAVPAQQPQAPPPAQPNHYFVPGVMVLVYWADGNRYPGTVLQVAPQHVLVAFPNGSQQWIDVRYVTMGK